MEYSWLALVPPIIVIVCAFLFHNINLSLAIGVVTSCLVAKNFSFEPAVKLALSQGWNTISDFNNLVLYAFLLTIGILIAVITSTGSAQKCAYVLAKRVKDHRSAELFSIFLSYLLCIDDYLSILTAGFVMRHVTDCLGIAREKLAFLIHSLAGSVVILAPFSSWVAAISAYVDQAGVGTNTSQHWRIAVDPIYIYIHALPYALYSFFIIASVWFIISKKISYGPMRRYEVKALQNYSSHMLAEYSNISNKSVNIVVIPIATLIIATLIGMPIIGGWWIFGGPYNFMDAIKHNQYPFLAMLIAGILGVIISIKLAFDYKLIQKNQVLTVIHQGWILMKYAILMVFLASVLSALLANHVGTGQYLASLVLGSVPVHFFPALFFILSLIITLATGSAWGTFALIIPIAVPMLTALTKLPLPVDIAHIPFFFPIFGAIFSGATCGDHISPLSETTTMTATSTEVPPMTHTYTQFPYAFPAILATLVGYIILGFLGEYSIYIQVAGALSIGFIICFTFLSIANYTKK